MTTDEQVAPGVAALRNVVDDLLTLKWTAEKRHPRNDARIDALAEALRVVTRHIDRLLAEAGRSE